MFYSEIQLIPTSFCINVATAGAIIMYDRAVSLGKFPCRPITPNSAPMPKKAHIRGGVRQRRKPSKQKK